MKKSPAKKYENKTGRKAIIGSLTEESKVREQQYLKNGCNAFGAGRKRPISTPLAFWTEQDILKYIFDNKIPYPSVYGNVICEDGIYSTTGAKRTGCIFCGFGAHKELHDEARFIRLKETHPKLYNYCMNGGEVDEHGDFKPSSLGLGLRTVFDEVSRISLGNIDIEY